MDFEQLINSFKIEKNIIYIIFLIIHFYSIISFCNSLLTFRHHDYEKYVFLICLIWLIFF